MDAVDYLQRYVAVRTGCRRGTTTALGAAICSSTPSSRPFRLGNNLICPPHQASLFSRLCFLAEKVAMVRNFTRCSRTRNLS
ncbi:hypothetical protein Taro_008469 [Colocasia esculenta]|uniref:Uncharacterized protein n=1 Tax=Colocasia esculenta TaxID=4460 RepID=A0A843TYB3_COLES|nr:hypothetical protein [Colocasia esculenta]